MKVKGKFISFEGPDGSGKTSVLKTLTRYLDAKGIDYILTREPGGSPIAEKIREVILNTSHTEMDYRTEALLYAASRRQHLLETIIPALEQGKLVITDRFVDSSLAYQGIARDLPVEEVWAINQFAIQGHLPDLTLLIDIPAEEGLDRIYNAQGTRQFDRLDREDLIFHEKVRQAYLEMAENNPRFVKIDGKQTIEEVAEECYIVLQEHHII